MSMVQNDKRLCLIPFAKAKSFAWQNKLSTNILIPKDTLPDFSHHPGLPGPMQVLRSSWPRCVGVWKILGQKFLEPLNVFILNPQMLNILFSHMIGAGAEYLPNKEATDRKIQEKEQHGIYFTMLHFKVLYE